MDNKQIYKSGDKLILVDIPKGRNDLFWYRHYKIGDLITVKGYVYPPESEYWFYIRIYENNHRDYYCDVRYCLPLTKLKDSKDSDSLKNLISL